MPELMTPPEAPAEQAPLVTPSPKKMKKTKAAAASKSTPTTKELHRQKELCRVERADRIFTWTDSVEFHRGTPFETGDVTSRIPVNKDWPRVKARVSSLFGQMPEVRLMPRQEGFKPCLPIFGKELNDTLKRADTDEAVYQALVDNTATAGIGVVMCSYQQRVDTQDAPLMDTTTIPEDQLTQLQAENKIPMEEGVEVPTDHMFSVVRLSPSDLLWPTGFTGFNFDKADWIGRTGEMSWSEAKHEFGLEDGVKEKVLGGGKDADQTLKQNEALQETKAKQPVVEFDEIFYWAYRFDPTEKYFKRIKRVVFVQGLKEPVKHEDWTGQKFDEKTGKYIGACKFPVRVLKIAYVSDDPIPPSESAIGRPQVLEEIDFRTDMHDQRKRSKPMNWVNTSKFDPDTLVNLLSGKIQQWIPINGRGEDAIGPLNRAQYPPENGAFLRTIQQDLDEVWQTSANQNGSFASGERSASEAHIVQQNYDMRNGMDRAMLAKFIQGIGEVMAGLLALYGDFSMVPPQDAQRLASWDKTQIAGEFVYEVIPDSMVRLDAHQQIKLNMDILNMVGKSGFVNPQGIIADVLALAGRDPGKDITQPNAPSPEPLNISIRSAEDLHDPLMLALLMQTKQCFSPEQLAAAQKVLGLLQQGTTIPVQAPQQPAPDAVNAPPDAATAPQDMNVMSKISKRGDYN